MTATPHLSVVCFTGDPPDRVALALGPLREVADEIVVAVDHRVDPDHLDPLRPVVDRLVRAEFVAPLEANLAWLHAQASGRWVLRVDGDEVASRALVERLAARDWDRDVTHLLVERRWLWTGPDAMLDTRPWWPDPQLRLVRAGTGLGRFPLGAHQPPEVAGWSRHLVEPLYHLDLLLADEATRAAKAARYDRARPGMRTEDGLDQNLGFYVPERTGLDLVTRPVPPEDRDLLTRVLAGAAHGGHGSGGARADDPGPIVTAADRRPPPPIPGGGAVRVLESGPPAWPTGRSITVTVEVENRTDATWSPDDQPPTRVGLRLVDEDGAPAAAEARGELPCPVRPGRREVVRAAVGPVPPPGRYRLEVGIVQEEVAWYDDVAAVPIVTERGERVVVSGGYSRYRHLGDDLIVGAVLAALVEAAPRRELVLLADDPADATARYGPPAVLGSNHLVHRGRPAGMRTALTRIAALRRDARRRRRGLEVLDPLHQPLIDVLADASVLVLAGAGWCTSRFRVEQLWPRLAEVEVARALGVPVVFEAGTIGPVDGPADRLVVRRLLAPMARVSVRDGARSTATARRLGVADDVLVQVPDAATAAVADDLGDDDARAWLRARNIDPDRPYVVVSVRDTRDPIAASDDDATVDTLVAVLDAVAAAGIPALFLPHCVDPATDDRPAGRAVAERANLFVDDLMPPDDVAVSLVRGAALAVGNRFHLALLADAAGVPALFLAATAFDHLRAGAFTGGNVELVDAAVGGGTGAATARSLLERGRRRGAAPWDPAGFGEAVRAAIAAGARR